MKLQDITLSWDMGLKLQIIEEILQHRYSTGKCECCDRPIKVDNYKAVFSLSPINKMYTMSINTLRVYRTAIINIHAGNELRTADRAWCHLCTFECIAAIYPSSSLGDRDE